MPPTIGHGKICYLEIPCSDVRGSADFYAKVFGWEIRERGNGHLSFDDGVGEVSGTWVQGRPPADDNGLRVWIMVENAVAALDAIVTHGGTVHAAIGADAPEITARFRDPYGNLLGIYQEPVAE